MFWNRSRPRVAEVTPAEAHERVISGEGILADIREPHEWRAGHAAGARHVPLSELARRVAELPKERPFYGVFAREVKPQIGAAYVATGKVRFEWHDFAWMGPESDDAANAARCAADQGAF